MVVSGQTIAPEETLVLTNGRIHTLDAANTIATSVMIRNGRFISINAAPAAGPGIRVVNLGGRTVVPGLVEPHIHIVSLANRPGFRRL